MVRILFLVFVVLGFSQLSIGLARAEGAIINPYELRILDWNTETGSDQFGPASCGKRGNELLAYSRSKVAEIANTIIANKIELAFFQEMNIRCLNSFRYNETEELAKVLNDRGYKMYFTYQPFIDKQTQSFHVSTFSKFPFKEGSIIHYPLGDITTDTRYTTKADIVLPNQTTIRTYNVHTRNTIACNHVLKYFDIVNRDTFPMVLLAGDFNTVMMRANERDNCGVPLDNYVLNTTVANLNSALSIINKPIDYNMLRKNASWSLASSSYQPHGSEDHPLVHTVVRVAGSAVPVVTPTSPTGLRLDLNLDGQLSDQDLRMIISSFGRTDCRSNVVGSSSECAIDLFDYSAWLGNYRP